MTIEWSKTSLPKRKKKSEEFLHTFEQQILCLRRKEKKLKIDKNIPYLLFSIILVLYIYIILYTQDICINIFTYVKRYEIF